MHDPLEYIKDAVIHRKKNEVEGLVKNALDSGVSPGDIVNRALIEAMDVVGKEFAASSIFMPEMLVSALTMKAGLEVVKPLLREKGAHVESKGKVVVATVKGDLHDIGKNIVAMMVEGAGFEVVDLGINIDGREIVEAVRSYKPDILGLSALLTTTMLEMRKVIEALGREGLRDRVKILVGGAPVNDAFAVQIGADGFGRDAAAAVNLCRKMVKRGQDAA